MNLSDEYNNRELVPDHPRIVADWYREAADYRARARFDADLVYGARQRNRVDLFHPDVDKGGPLVVFIHGGYWKTFDKSGFSHIAAGANAHGLTVAIAGYSLCPDVTVPDIIDEVRQCCLFLHQHTGRKLFAAGHSAGGHLAACMAATDWSLLGAPADLVSAGFAISGVFDLRPIMATPHNQEIRLTAVDALSASPLLWPLPRPLAFDSWVGSDESFEFKRQARSLAAAWTGLGATSDNREVPGENHFSVCRGWAEPASDMTRRLVELAGC